MVSRATVTVVIEVRVLVRGFELIRGAEFVRGSGYRKLQVEREVEEGTSF